MTGTDFEFDLERAFREPAPDVDTAALERAILGRVQRADRRRWLVLSGATVLGLAIVAAVVLGFGFVAAVHEAWLELRAAIELEAPDAPWSWAPYALVGLIVAASIARAARES